MAKAFKSSNWPGIGTDVFMRRQTRHGPSACRTCSAWSTYRDKSCGSSCSGSEQRLSRAAPSRGRSFQIVPQAISAAPGVAADSSTFCKIEEAAIEWNNPSAGVLEVSVHRRRPSSRSRYGRSDPVAHPATVSTTLAVHSREMAAWSARGGLTSSRECRASPVNRLTISADGIHPGRAPGVRGHQKACAKLMDLCSLALKALAQSTSWHPAFDAPIRVAKRSNFAASANVACKASSRAFMIRLEIERVADAAFDTNPFAFVIQLRFVAGRAGWTDIVALLRRPSVRNEVWRGRPEIHPGLVRGFAVCGMRPSRSLFASERKSSWLPATSRLMKMS